jgi:hypothetical protein
MAEPALVTAVYPVLRTRAWAEARVVIASLVIRAQRAARRGMPMLTGAPARRKVVERRMATQVFVKTIALTLVKLDQIAHLMTSNETILNIKLLEIIKIYILYIVHFFIWICLSQS